MKPIWSNQEIINIEYFIYIDEKDSCQDDNLHLRDRKFFLEAINHDSKFEQAPKTTILYRWLQFRKTANKASEILLPGDFYAEVLQLLRILFLGIGLFSGSGLGFSFFTYTGSAPLNVFYFLAAFIVSQIILLSILFISTLIRRKKRQYLSSSLIYSTLSKTLFRLFIITRKHLYSQLTGKAINSFESTMGYIQGKREYGTLFYWPLFIRLQLFGMGFNLGLLGVTLFKIITSDLAFGWQSTIQFSPETIHSFVHLLSLPWSWFVENGYPTLSQIEGSRMILKDGLYHLATQDLTSWWPFLTWGLIAYGLLPRLCLLIYGSIRERNTLGKITFDQASHDFLLQRMKTPHVATQAEPEEQLPSSSPPIHESIDDKSCTIEPDLSSTNIVVMIPDDFYDSCPGEMLIDILMKRGYNPVERVRFGEDFEDDQQILTDMKESDWSKTSGILILMEAWMPPITDFTFYLKQLRVVIPEKTIIRIGLLGKPTPTTVFTPVTTEDFHVWQQKITAMGDAYLRLEHIVP